MRLVATLLLALWAGMLAAAAQGFDERLATCLSCHGEKGTSENPDTPSLGGQPSPYLLIQLYMFRERLRISEVMNEMTKGLSDADLQKFADLVAKLPAPRPADGGEPARVTRGREVAAQHRCGFCHNADFSGADSVPRISGQREDYLAKTLREYKSGERREYQSVMAEVVRPLADADLADLAHFLARVR